MIKAFLVDGDGLTIRQYRYFTEVCSEKYNLPLEKISPFFKGPFQDCQRGKSDLKVSIAPFLKDWGWDKTEAVIDQLKQMLERHSQT